MEKPTYWNLFVQMYEDYNITVPADKQDDFVSYIDSINYGLLMSDSYGDSYHFYTSTKIYQEDLPIIVELYKIWSISNI